MVFLIVAAALAVAQQTDTTFSVPANGRLALEVHDGSAVVRTWDRRELRVQATHGDRVRVDVRQRGGVVSVEAESRTGAPARVSYEITVPRQFAVSVEGINLVTTVEGVQGRVSVENVEGAITIRNVVGDVDVESVSGRVLVENVRGRVSAETINQGLRLLRVTGAISAETVNGSIAIEGADSDAVDVSTMNGMISFDGAVRDGGRYSLHAYNGAVTMGIPDGANATVRVSTRNGRIESAFPVTVRGTLERSVSFTLGSGSARIDLESQNGSINLIRPRGR